MELKPGYKQTEVGIIPENWNVSDFDELGSVIDGDRGSQYPSEQEFSSSGFCLFLNAGNVTKNGFNFRKCAFVSREKDAALNNGKLKRDDIILTTRGTVGNIAYFDASVSHANMRINSGMVILRSSPTSLDAAFFYVLIRSHLLQSQIDRLAFGSAQPQLTVQSISKFKVVVPPLPEQRAIAAALSDTDSLLSSLDRLIVKKRDIKQVIMQQLLTGKQRLPGFSGEWEVKRLGELGEVASAGVDKKIRPDEVLVRLVNYLDVYKKDFIFTEDLHHVVTATTAQASRCQVRKGDVFFTPSSEVRDDIAHSAVAMEDIQDAVYSYHVVRLRLSDDWDLRFRAYAFKTKAFFDQAHVLCDGSGTRYVISQGKFRTMTVLVPPVLEQTAIAAVLSDMDAEIDALTRRRDKTRVLKQGMMQELLTGRTRLV